MNKFILTILLMVGIFFPTFQSQLESSGAILVNGLLLLISFAFLLISIRDGIFKVKAKWLIILISIYSFMLLHLTLSILIGYYFSNVSILIRDVFEYSRPLYNILLILSFVITIGNIENCNQYLIKILNIIFIIMVFFAFSQFFKLNGEFLSLYTKQHNLNTGRSSAPFINPYDLGFMLCFYLFFYMHRFFFHGKKYLPYLIICFPVIFFTQSRTVFIVALFGLFIIPILVYIRSLLRGWNRESVSLIISFGIVFILVVIMLYPIFIYLREQFPYLINGIYSLVSGEKVNSLSMRYKQFDLIFYLANENLMIAFWGNGPAKDLLEFVESSYAFYLFRFGILGLLLYFITPLVIAITLSVKIFLKNSFCSINFAGLVWLLTIPIASIGNNFTDQIRLSLFYVFLLSFIIVKSLNENDGGK
ncbi:hypothetical protein [Vibrio splendidus]|uniref:hypothetical protein n=1 Tax=Vibrio splendidus TaxID=29497 RepID=UPI000D366B7D|nr:hypothetical protein [Vibrio splendidus]PTP48082.1 hypothetical protein CWO05_23210 [Vibrio splendidus]